MFWCWLIIPLFWGSKGIVLFRQFFGPSLVLYLNQVDPDVVAFLGYLQEDRRPLRPKGILVGSVVLEGWK